ncbi:VOC family protein [Shewanella sp. 202IG2-18]|uniref:VOC family protein n=1 Tax=Parashewanella hymeniacidonis TaxID=2807618 RepID=UPI001961BF01|nr:VOC family protein [Parashewanella hymeniacidonis]MBM7071174.1 VOC family protein [Parashewanella hymeniacidonis]
MFQFDHINLRVPETKLIKEKDFFCEILSLKDSTRVNQKSKGFWLSDSQDNIVIHLSVLSSSNPIPTNTGVIDHIAFRSSNVDKFYDHLEEHDIPSSIKYHDNNNVTQIFFYSPSGIKIEANFTNEKITKKAPQ